MFALPTGLGFHPDFLPQALAQHSAHPCEVPRVHNLARAKCFTGTRWARAAASAKAPDVITWTIDLANLRAVGDKDAGTIIKAWNLEASNQQQPLGSKTQTLKNVLDLMPQEILGGVVIPAVREMGWEKVPVV